MQNAQIAMSDCVLGCQYMSRLRIEQNNTTLEVYNNFSTSHSSPGHVNEDVFSPKGSLTVASKYLNTHTCLALIRPWVQA